MAVYSWLNLATARQQLADRLNDPTFTVWTAPECTLYIQRALRQFNSLTATWNVDFVYNSTDLWNSLGELAGSPRLRTVTDTQTYTMLEYFLLEPPTGATWTGTSQFSIDDLSQAVQSRRDEMMQVSACNEALLTGIASTPFSTRASLPDTVIDVPRVRYIPATVGIPPVTPPPVTLYRDDTVALEFYQAPLYQLPTGTPETFQLSSEPQLTFDVNIAPNQPATFEAVVIQSGTPLTPPTATILGIPDDFTWVLEYGAMADLLGRESEATDRLRADYCMRRYQDGLNLLLKTPWIMLGKVDNVAVTVDALEATDRYMPEWDSTPADFGPCIVIAGIDFLAAPVGHGIGVTVLGNAPIPVADNDPVQVSRSNWDTVLDLAQAAATFKYGGAEFQAGLELEKRAIMACAAENSRIKSMGAFSDILMQRGQLQDFNQARYNSKGNQ